MDSNNIKKNRDLYDSNEDFKHFVDKYAYKHDLDIDVALTHRIITITRKQIEDKNDIQQAKIR